MTQAVGLSAVNALVRYSLNGSAWEDISGYANSVKPGAGTRQTGVRFTHDGDIAIVTAGKRASIDIDVSVVYTETASPAPFEALRALFEAGTAVYFQWSPRGGTVGYFLYTSDPAVIKKLDYPFTDTEDAKPIAVSFTFETAKLTKSAFSS